MSMDQYLLMMRKSREEYLKERQPEAEKRVKRELVLDQVAKQENIGILPEEVEAIFRAYAQAGQPLPRSEDQIRAIALNYRREKALARLVELTTDPDPDAEVDEDETTSIENAQAAALAGEANIVEADNDVVEAEKPTTSVTDETTADVVE